MNRNAFLVWLKEKKLFFIFLLGKFLRFSFFTGFLYFLIKGAGNLAGYDVNQAVFFFLTFNVIDILAQFLFREVYRFRPLVISGAFDLVLVKPLSPLFRSLMGGADVIDLVTIPPLVAAVIYVGRFFDPGLIDVIYYFLLLLNGLLIATAFHIVALSLGIIILEIDHIIMIYRDMTNLGRLPVDIYREPFRSILTYLIPVGVMITLPAKALMGLASPAGVFFSFALGLGAIFVSLKFWRFALKNYTSASS